MMTIQGEIISACFGFNPMDDEVADDKTYLVIRCDGNTQVSAGNVTVTVWDDESSSGLETAASALLKALHDIANNLSADDPDSWRADDPEGAMDSAYHIAITAIAKAKGADE
jgi:hypothetical protein